MTSHYFHKSSQKGVRRMGKILTAIIADSDPLARNTTCKILRETENMLVIGEAATGTELLEITSILRPNVVIIDTHLNEVDGITVAKQLAEKDPNLFIVFTSTYPYYALDAFEIAAIDYLVKPVTSNRLKKGINRLRKYSSKRAKIQLYYEKSNHFLAPEEIIFVETSDRHSIIHTNQGPLRSTERLSKIEEKLKGFYFIRSHRSYLININFIKEINVVGDRAYNVVFEDYEKEAAISRNKKKKLVELLRLMSLN